VAGKQSFKTNKLNSEESFKNRRERRKPRLALQTKDLRENVFKCFEKTQGRVLGIFLKQIEGRNADEFSQGGGSKRMDGGEHRCGVLTVVWGETNRS